MMTTNPITREQIVEAARRYAGARFRVHGSDPLTGFDCRGYVRRVLDDLGYAVGADVPATYQMNARDTAQLITVYSSIMDEIDPAEADAGDFPVILTTKPSYHTGIFTRRDPLWIIHAQFVDRRRHGVMEQPFSEIYIGKIVNVFRLRGLAI